LIASPGVTRRVLVADDSAFMRKLIGEMIAENPGFSVVGFARDGLDALEQVERLQPDIVTLDLEMPRLDGLGVLKHIMSVSPRAVVVLSAGGPQYGDATLRALELGAVDFVRKPSGPVSLDLPIIRDRLMQALDAAAAARITAGDPAVCAPGSVARTVHSKTIRGSADVEPAPARHVVVIASSTGGPRALADIVPRLPANLGAAVVIAQHLPCAFTPALAGRLSRSSDIAVAEGDDGLRLLSGVVYIARGGTDTTIVGAPGNAYLRQTRRSSLSAASPSADSLFESAAAVFDRGCTGVVLTGMGRDGAAGLKVIRAAGGCAIVQDQESSAIYGMPRAALAEAGADHVVPLAMVATAITESVPEERLQWLTA
jgi:two-component system chemotaxis response regulator CheB